MSPADLSIVSDPFVVTCKNASKNEIDRSLLFKAVDSEEEEKEEKEEENGEEEGDGDDDFSSGEGKPIRAARRPILSDRETEMDRTRTSTQADDSGKEEEPIEPTTLTTTRLPKSSLSLRQTSPAGLTRSTTTTTSWRRTTRARLRETRSAETKRRRTGTKRTTTNQTTLRKTRTRTMTILTTSTASPESIPAPSCRRTVSLRKLTPRNSILTKGAPKPTLSRESLRQSKVPVPFNEDEDLFKNALTSAKAKKQR